MITLKEKVFKLTNPYLLTWISELITFYEICVVGHYVSLLSIEFGTVYIYMISDELSLFVLLATVTFELVYWQRNCWFGKTE